MLVSASVFRLTVNLKQKVVPCLILRDSETLSDLVRFAGNEVGRARSVLLHGRLHHHRLVLDVQHALVVQGVVLWVCSQKKLTKVASTPAKPAGSQPNRRRYLEDVQVLPHQGDFALYIDGNEGGVLDFLHAGTLLLAQ